MANPTSGVKDLGQSALEKTKETAGQLADKAKDAASKVGDMASSAASKVGEMASSAASTVGKNADKWTSAAGSGVKHFGETIKDKGPHEGVLGDATRAVADTIPAGRPLHRARGPQRHGRGRHGVDPPQSAARRPGGHRHRLPHRPLAGR